VHVDDFAQQRPPVAELRYELPKLMSGVSERNRLRIQGHRVAREQRRRVRLDRSHVEPQLARERPVERDQARRRDRGRRTRREEPLRQPAVAVLEPESDHGAASPSPRIAGDR
jgi:hypothetical protein